jgi:SAM-dependent methyltransferase
VEPWVEAVEKALPVRPARIVDAGCGTGRHAAELAARGHDVVLLEPVPELLAQARERLPGAQALSSDLAAAPAIILADAAACRGVLNDVVGDEARDAALRGLARLVRPGGVAVLDVRERVATAARYSPERVTERTAGDLSFVSRGRWDEAAGVVRARERHEHRGRVAEGDFVMRPWTEDELRERLARAGWGRVVVRPGRESRLLATATRSPS